MPKRKKNKKPKKPKRKLTNAEKKARRERKRKNRELFEYIFINGKQKRVRKSPAIDGLPVDEFIARNADPIFLHQNEMWEVLDQRARSELDFIDPADIDAIASNFEEPCTDDLVWWSIWSLPEDDQPITTNLDPRFKTLSPEQQEKRLEQARREEEADRLATERRSHARRPREVESFRL